MEANSSMLTPEHNGSTAAIWGAMPSAPSRQLGAPPKPEVHIEDLMGVFFMVSLNILALVSNAAVLLVVMRTPHLRKFAFVCHLCAVDLSCAALLMPLGIVCTSPFFSGVVFSAVQCQARLIINVFLIAASIFSVTAISVERYYYIVHPMRYEVKMTLRLAAAVMAAVWLAALLLGLSSLLGWPSNAGRGPLSAACCSLHWSRGRNGRLFSILFAVSCFCLPAAIISAVYCGVYKVARGAARRQGPLPSWTDARLKPRSDSINSQTTIITGRSAPRRRTTRERTLGGGKAALTLVLVVGQFVICWLPYFAFHLHLALDGAPGAAAASEATVTWLAYSSFAINPFIYALLNRQIREELCKLRRCCAVEPVFSSREGSASASAHENFLQFLHRTSFTAETGGSSATPAPRNTLDQTGPTGLRLPGQIPEEF